MLAEENISAEKEKYEQKLHEIEQINISLESQLTNAKNEILELQVSDSDAEIFSCPSGYRAAHEEFKGFGAVSRENAYAFQGHFGRLRLCKSEFISEKCRKYLVLEPPSHARMIFLSPARIESTSASELSFPSETRIVPFAKSSSSRIARSTCEISVLTLSHAEPVEMLMPIRSIL